MIGVNDPVTRTVNDTVKSVAPELALPEAVFAGKTDTPEVNLERSPKTDTFKRS